MNVKLSAFATFIFGVTSIGALADGFQIDIGGAYHEYDNDAFLEQEIGGNINLGYRYDNIAIEAGYTETPTNSLLSPFEDVDTIDMRIGGLFYFADIKNFEPFLYFGYSNYELDWPGRDDSDYDDAMQLGIGVKAFLTEGLYARFDTRHLHFEKELQHHVSTLSIGYRFGRDTNRVVKQVAAPKVPEEEPQVLDSDNDGVADDVDVCSNTPDGVTVDAEGCPLDSDGDGVVDYGDNCPNTDKKLKVDTSGCPITLKEEVSIDLKVIFASGSSEVPSQYVPEIAKVARFLEQYAGTRVVIEGHTDTSGSATYNKRLSQTRADAVAQILVSYYRVDASRVTAIGYGEEQPIADESTAEGKAANRRVVAVVSAQKESFQER